MRIELSSRRSTLVLGLAAGAAYLSLAAATAPAQVASSGPSPALSALPQVTAHGGVTSLVLRAEYNAQGKRRLTYLGKPVPPVVRIVPGGELRVGYMNALPVKSGERCAPNACMNMTNLHFHGLTVSPRTGQDDVLTMIAMPGQSLRYDVHLPATALPGLYWYHTHPHGESDREALDGMSGAIVVEGIDRYVPEVRALPERILVLRTSALDDKSLPAIAALKRRVDLGTAPCGKQSGDLDEIFSVNGAFRPSIAIAPGQRQFWRIVNASADTYADLAVDGTPLKVVAFDGVPLAYHDPAHPSRTLAHVMLPPAGRVEAIVTGPLASVHAALRTHCVDSGPDGDQMQSQVLADIAPQGLTPAPAPVSAQQAAPVYKPLDLAALERSDPRFVVTFTEGHHQFFINDRTFSLDAPPMTTVRVGTYVHWRVVNRTNEIHPFHIHQVHFLAYAQDRAPVEGPAWRDTVNVPLKSTIDVILDATDPVIRGMSVFHCHILSHEDKGMMAKVLFQ
jgi:FtsP/CotA-like multicopper oxidase with cupredoxin domain